MTMGCCVAIRSHFREYCNRSSVHGCQYIGEKERPYLERFWWFFVFATSLTACAYNIYQVYLKWEESPVIVNLSNGGTPIYKIPFPAITICSESKYNHDLLNFTDVVFKIENQIPPAPTEKKYFEYVSLINNFLLDNYTYNSSHSEEFYDVVYTLRPKFSIQDCSIGEQSFDCNKEFVPIFTEEGLCYTFNMIDRSEIFKKGVIHYKNFLRVNHKSTNWTLQDGYAKDAPVELYPRRALLSGATNGLNFRISTSKQNYNYSILDSIEGYRVTAHTPMTIPRPSLKYFRIPLDQNIAGSITPIVISTSKTIRMYNPKRRNCYFGTERQLKYFKMYTSSNCKVECLTNYTLARCNCVNYFMPREKGTPICSTSSIKCMNLARRAMQMVDLANRINDTTYKQMHSLSMDLKCNCLPICSDLTYEVDVSQVDWTQSQQTKKISSQPYVLSVTLFFQTDEFISSERNELYGPIDFLANFGGLLGLFTGFSVLSLAEIVYFLTVRIACNKWAKREN